MRGVHRLSHAYHPALHIPGYIYIYTHAIEKKAEHYKKGKKSKTIQTELKCIYIIVYIIPHSQLIYIRFMLTHVPAGMRCDKLTHTHTHTHTRAHLFLETL
eukprot:TRINITY_DN2171_c1_g1_i5.p2 TRINITY_DN2171_c1_g1~~TRINITY_DN2171_c1_g1_i5.p2  ORF type:complete len:101 (+),score=2.59 TRINITY_DN2171_c1_g1_i5:660-962(+)